MASESVLKALNEIKESNRRPGPTERQVTESFLVIERDYEDDVYQLCLSIVDRYLDGEELDLHDMLHEEIDGSHRVIYTRQAQVGLIVSDNADAAAQEMGEDEAGDVSQRMYFALQEDVVDFFHDAGCDINALSGSTKRDLKACKRDLKAHFGRRKPPTEKQIDAAFEVIRKDYYHDVWDEAESLLQRIADGEIKDSEGFTEALDESIDGDRRVFVTFKAKLGLLASDNEDAMEDELGEEASSQEPEKRMFWAMRQDVLETLDGFRVDVNDEATFGDDDEDE